MEGQGATDAEIGGLRVLAGDAGKQDRAALDKHGEEAVEACRFRYAQQEVVAVHHEGAAAHGEGGVPKHLLAQLVAGAPRVLLDPAGLYEGGEKTVDGRRGEAGLR